MSNTVSAKKLLILISSTSSLNNSCRQQTVEPTKLSFLTYTLPKSILHLTMLSFSIAICTFNPEQALLGSLLEAVSRLSNIRKANEIIIVDNASTASVSNLPEVSNFLEDFSQSQCLLESRKGLTSARCRAIRETSGDILIFFDDDNLPAQDYVDILLDAFLRYRDVAVWGPGTINVFFAQSVSPLIQQHRVLYQERNSKTGYIHCPATWGPYCPHGTGFAVRRDVLESYASKVDSGHLGLTDRLGDQLTSGGDNQIVWECFRLGLAAGVLENLKCGHLISRKKTCLNYLKRLSFGCSSSWYAALLQSWPDHQIAKKKIPSWWEFRLRYFWMLIKSFLFPSKAIILNCDFASWLGDYYGYASTVAHPKFSMLRKLATRYRLV